jgi:hypothetical protein
MNLRLFGFCAVLTIALIPGACAEGTGSTEARYVTARDSAIQSLVTQQRSAVPESTLVARVDSALASLEERLRAIIGPVTIQGIADRGRINVRNLLPGYVDGGELDGLQYRGSDSSTVVIVSTRRLFDLWLDGLARSFPGSQRDLASIARSGSIYTRAISADAAVQPYAEIVIPDSSRKGLIAALLVFRAQDIGAFTPDEIVATVVRGGRVYVMIAPAAVKIAPAARCLAIRDSLLRQHAPIDGGDQADIGYRRCYGEHASGHQNYSRLVAQVEQLVAALPPK